MDTDKTSDRTAEEIACESGDPTIPCRCRGAVQRAYREMVASGSSHAEAHMAAAKVYRHHHPGYPVDRVNRLVARLVGADQLH